MRFQILYCLAILISPLAIVGCNVIGAVAAKTAPAETFEAQYTFGSDPMVVVAENWRNPAGASIDADQLAQFVSADLHQHNVAPQIDPTAVVDLKSQSHDFHSLTIAQIGKRVGAKHVLYINITEMSLTSPIASETLSGKCSARVKIIDTESSQAVWPEDAAQGYAVTVKTPTIAARSESDETALRQSLEEQLASKISRLFYKTTSDD